MIFLFSWLKYLWKSIQTKLLVTSEVPIYQVFSDDPSNSGSKPISDHMRSVMDDLVSAYYFPCPDRSKSMFQGLTDQVVGGSSMFTGEEEVFAFARACSRLVQMGSKEWAEMARHI